jgi:ABC-2 type transport system permease protein
MNGVIAAITARALFGRRRVLLLALLPLILLGLAAVFRAGGATDTRVLLGNFGVTALAPLVALIVGTGVLGAELDDGTAIYLLATPTPRRTIVITKLAVAALVAIGFSAVPELLAGLIAFPGQPRLAVAYAIGVAVGSLVYVSIFVALSVVTRRAMAVGLLYVLVWEGLLASFVSGIGVLSVQQYMLSITRALSGATEAVSTNVAVGAAIPLAAIVVGAATWIAVDRLSSYRVTGDVA